ncbi:hypothetical protein MCOR05_001675 [Pyricularia oryzae]|nr:hypothetical protein MCOR05_001675 [Pyricularia oryzae]KAI6558682.1 hypothetical protein MCOR09_009014 [Pyricularia oryzae]
MRTTEAPWRLQGARERWNLTNYKNQYCTGTGNWNPRNHRSAPWEDTTLSFSLALRGKTPVARLQVWRLGLDWEYRHPEPHGFAKVVQAKGVKRGSSHKSS